MGSSQDHIKQWKHNRDFLARVPPEFPDWQVTVAFYVALHAVDSLLAHEKVPRINSHDARNSALLNTNRYAFIKDKYLPLYDLSRRVRYLAEPAKWVPPDRIQTDVVHRYLSPIEQSVQKLMGQDLGLTAIQLNAVPPRAGPVSPPP
jgi:hypothetical protein